MKVKLESVGNPDMGQDPNKPMYGCEPNKVVPVKTFKEARDACMKFISENGLGAGNWSGGQILDDDKVIAHVSCNGRVWEGESWTAETKEIKV